MRLHGKLYTFTFLFVLFILAILQLFVLRQTKPSKSVIIVDPGTKKHWFRLKINNQANFHPRNQMGGSQKTILLWTKFFGNKNFFPAFSDLHCRMNHCQVTSNRSYLLQSDAIIFHLRDINLADMPSTRQPWHRWILLHHESPPHTPDILNRLSGQFNWTATYRWDSDIILSPLTMRKKTASTITQDFHKSKTRMVAWFVSNCYSSSNREGYVKELQNHIPVDIYGACGTHECLPKMSDECYKKISDEYRYYLAFENSICKDYVTEKFFNVLNTDMIPIVMGGANYSQFAPPSSFINALQFESPKDLAHFLLNVAKDEKKYNRYFDWKEKYVLSYEHYACQTCRKLHEDNAIKFYENLHDWWFKEANCRTWSVD